MAMERISKKKFEEALARILIRRAKLIRALKEERLAKRLREQGR